MRLRPLLLVASLALTLFAMPTASAIGCPGPSFRVAGPDGDVVAQSHYPACGFDLTLNEGKECADGADDWNHVPGGLVNVYFNACGDPDQGLLDAPFQDPVGEPPAPHPFGACPGGLEAPDATAPHVRDDCNPDPHLTYDSNPCPNYYDHRTVAYENVSVSYNYCYNLVPTITNPLYKFPSNVCGQVPEYGVVDVAPDCRRVEQGYGCPDGHEHPVKVGPYDGVVYHCGPV